ncbi:hypothetical protein [Roseiconus lacunae]|nr:hypothetical protein [Roseiconus lacunae]
MAQPNTISTRWVEIFFITPGTTLGQTMTVTVDGDAVVQSNESK